MEGIKFIVLTYPLKCWIHQGQTKPGWHYGEWVKFFYSKFCPTLLFNIITQIKPLGGKMPTFFKRKRNHPFPDTFAENWNEATLSTLKKSRPQQADTAMRDGVWNVSDGNPESERPLEILGWNDKLRDFAMGLSDLFKEKFTVTWLPKLIIVQNFASERLCLQFTCWHAWWRENLKI